MFSSIGSMFDLRKPRAAFSCELDELCSDEMGLGLGAQGATRFPKRASVLQNEILEEMWLMEELLAPPRALNNASSRTLVESPATRVESAHRSHSPVLRIPRSSRDVRETTRAFQRGSSWPGNFTAPPLPPSVARRGSMPSSSFASFSGNSSTAPSPAPTAPSIDALEPAPGVGFGRWRTEALFSASYKSFRKLFVPRGPSP